MAQTCSNSSADRPHPRRLASGGPPSRSMAACDTNENTATVVLRSILPPKATDLYRHSDQAILDAVAFGSRLNGRPRKTGSRIGRIPSRGPHRTLIMNLPHQQGTVATTQLNPGQYLSIRYSMRLAEAGISPSVGSVGDSYDNALAESVIGLYKTELIRPKGPWKRPGPSRVRHPRVRGLVQPPPTPRTNRTHPTSREGGQLPSSTKASPASWTQVKHSPTNPVRFKNAKGHE